MIDKQYLAMVRDGDMDGFTALREFYRSALIACTYSAFKGLELPFDTITTPEHVAEETWTDFVMHVIKQGYEHIDNVIAYLCRAAHNKAYKTSLVHRRRVSFNDLLDEVLPSKDSIEDEVIQRETSIENSLTALKIILLINQMPELPAKQRAALLLRDVAGATSREIAYICDVKPGSVDSMISQARAKIRKRLGVVKAAKKRKK